MFSFSVGPRLRSQYVGIEKLVLDGVTIYLVDNEYYFGDKIYRGGSAEGEQYAFFHPRGAGRHPPNLGFFPDVLHLQRLAHRPCCPCCCARSTATLSTGA